MTTRRLLSATAALEAATGLALLVAPSAVVFLLLGTHLDAAVAVTLGRITGAALLALALACWTARDAGQSRSARGLTAGMLIYDLAVLALLALARSVDGLSGPLFWPAIAAHAALGLWCLAALSGRDHDQG